MPHRWIMFALAVGYLATVTGSAGAAEYYVDSTAPKPGDGSPNSPWQDIMVAISKLQPGDVLVVRGSKSGAPMVYPSLTASPDTAAADDSRPPVTTWPAGDKLRVWPTMLQDGDENILAERLGEVFSLPRS